MNMIHEAPNGVRHFVCDEEVDIGMLPTLDTAGKGVLVTVKKTAVGSMCKVIGSGAVYMLNSQNVWTKTSSGGGSSPEPEPWDIADRDDIDHLFD